MKNAHIINVLDGTLQQYMASGYLGVGFKINGTTVRQLSHACTTSYSMYSDMLSVRQGDLLLVHEGEYIYGAFEATTDFAEDPGIPVDFLSANMLYRDSRGNGLHRFINRPLSSITPWDFRRVGIREWTVGGASVCYSEGIHSTRLFHLKARGRIWSIPERWKYADAGRIVRPILMDEANILIEAIELENHGKTRSPGITSAPLSGYLPIELILDPNRVVNEKIVEAWIIKNIGKNTVLDTIVGKFTCFGNNVPIGYLKLMDIYGYLDFSGGARLHKVIEVKKAGCVFPDNVVQLVNYMNLVSSLSPTKRESNVEGFLFANSFDQQTIDFVKHRNRMDARLSLIQFDYVPPQYDRLDLRRVV